jgi:hypothetical protein
MESMLDIRRKGEESEEDVICLLQYSNRPEAQKLRSTAVIFLALSSSVSGLSAVFATGKHHSFWFGAVLGFGIVMIVASIILLNRAATMGREQN